jgi:superfamily II DNA or RNA helicase
MSLKSLHFSPVLDTSSSNIIHDFFEPMLSIAKRYDRGVGYFSAGWLRVAAKGMSDFAKNGGKARWITSPILDQNDWEAMLSGVEARQNEALAQTMKRNIIDIEMGLEEATRSALAWLVADGIIDFKLAVPRNRHYQGEFHAKFGIFTDAEENQISFHGSYNDSIQGNLNYETLSVFCSWEEHTLPYVQHSVSRFERLWNNEDSNFRVYDLPEAAREQILKLRTQDRPYPLPQVEEVPSEVRLPQRSTIPQIPASLQLREYQLEAIDAWFDHNCRGLLEMATGTGKTITSLAATVRLFEREKRLAVVISVPYQHLVDQWYEETKAFGYQAILAYKSKQLWIEDLNHQILDFNAGYRSFISVITTHTTFASPDFQQSIARIEGSALMLADEAHHLGAERSRTAYPHHIPYRLALSATPDRWFDDVGTAALRSYFGETVFAFPLEKAIGVSLTPYYYYPHLVPLTDDEMEQYEELTEKIAKLINREDDIGQEQLKFLLIKRANLLNKAEGKIKVLDRLIDEQKHISHTLFYCAPGQIDDVLRLVGLDKDILAHRFTAEENTSERQQLLSSFAKGDLEALVAMKCLDEGVDVPSTHMAFFLASSSNPREFIQRRGRVLRKSPGKEFSILHDLIAVPPSLGMLDLAAQNVERSIVKRELQRFSEFADLATNKYEARDVIWELAKHHELTDF